MLIQSIRSFNVIADGFYLRSGEMYQLEYISYVNVDGTKTKIYVECNMLEMPDDGIFQCGIKDLNNNKVSIFWSFYFDIEALKRNICINEILK